MWVETDCDFNATHPTVLGIHIENVTQANIAEFNKKFSGKAHVFSYKNSAILTDTKKILLLWKVWDDEDPNHNMSPFETSDEAEGFLLEFKKLCNINYVGTWKEL
jgi:hypothetical protein